MTDSIRTTPPGGAPKELEVVSTRPDVQFPLPSFNAFRTTCPAPSWYTFDVDDVIVSISPVPNEDPAPVSYFQLLLIPDPDAPVKSSLHVVVKPDGGAGMLACAGVTATAVSTRGAAVRSTAMNA